MTKFSGLLQRRNRRAKERRHPVLRQRLEQLLVDMEKDPEGRHWSHDGDYRIPAWYAGTDIVTPPAYVEEILRGVPGPKLELLDFRHNWPGRKVELVQWFRSWEPDPATGIALCVLVPLAVEVVEGESWAEVTPGKVRSWVRHANWGITEAEQEAADKAANMVAARRTVMRLAEKISQGMATGEEREEYEAAVKVTDGAKHDELRERWKAMRSRAKKIAEDLGL